MDYKKIYNEWIKDDNLAPVDKKELLNIADDEKEIEYRFGANLAFGTAGMRGLIGIGTNMMNVYTVKRATKGLAEYVKTLGKSAMKRGVVVSYDTRRNSDLFAMATVGVLLANGIKVRVFKNPSPVPMLSYAVRTFKAVAGVMITASHNPKEYNGYKVYGSDGAQMSPEATKIVVDFINGVENYLAVDAVDYKVIKNAKGVKTLGLSFVKKYVNTLLKLSLSKEAVKNFGKDLKIVYTPLHGTGYTPVTELLKKLGLNVSIVSEQVKPDPEFSTVEVPNPETTEAMTLGVRLADKIGADVVFGTDPDSDRLGVAIRNDNGEFINLTGNQVGVLLTDYVLKRLTQENALAKDGVIIKSFVSTGMVKPVCEAYGVKLIEVPVGFKFIGEKIKQFEDTGKGTFLFGFEESCGYLRGTHARDKDAVVASMLFAEMVCYYAYTGVSVYKVLCDLYEKYGYVVDKTVSVGYKGLSAMADMAKVVEKMRSTKLSEVGGYKIVATRDYLSGVKTLSDGKTEQMDISGVNCVYYELEVGGFICLRPSGTEPKLKIYYSVSGKDRETAENSVENLIMAFSELLK
ncbi:MAG: phospho-sugar mutase [Clostridia bacterium]|nr:phospho-sugar mutase [Clostridia bacterium]